MIEPAGAQRFAPAVVLAFSIALAAGCGDSREFSSEARYSPESLAQELSFRFKNLPATGKTSKKSRKPQKGPAESKADETVTAKTSAKEATKKRLATTVDDLLDEIQSNLAKVPDTAPAEVARRASDAISKDLSLDEDDRRMLSGRLIEMAGP